jgi:leucyl-tRNA synthetase
MPSDTQPQAPARPHRYGAALAGAIEPKWQRAWATAGTFNQPNPGEPGFDPTKPKFYCLDMFPYPSGAGLHVGHPEGYTATDILCRYKRMRGFNVLHPMGWDAFGLPAEQYAIQTGVHPAKTTRQAIDTFRRQLQRFGFCYDWSRELGTIDPDYYKWTQWIFLQIYGAWYDPDRKTARPIDALVQEFASGARPIQVNPHAAEFSADERSRVWPDWGDMSEDDRRTVVDSYRLAYIAEQTVNWCPKLGTALANEEVIDGKSERGSFPVFRKPLKQWMFRITAYADRLLEGLDSVDWPTSTRIQQTEWIGRSEGAEIEFPLLDPSNQVRDESLRVFTTRPDTIFGATYMVVAPEHPLVDEAIATGAAPDTEALKRYAAEARNRSDVERQEAKTKTGVFTGVNALNPATGEPIPVWTSDYVLMGYGTGAIMAVPGQDERDWEFAEAFDLPIVRTVEPPKDFDGKAFTGEGAAINSANNEVSLNGLNVDEAKTRIIDWLESKGLGQRKVNFKLRDWLFSRQRYWGEPFPIVWDEQGYHHPVGEDKLPVTLPDLADYQPVESEEPKPLLGKAADWMRTTAGEAGAEDLDPDAPVTRELNTMPGWAGSCWYYLRYCDPKNPDRFAEEEAERYWMSGGVDLYIGGAEHAVLHLLYARFWHKVLFDLGHVSTDEPFKKLFHQGLILSHAYQRADKSLVPIDKVENQGSEEEPAYIETATGVEVAQIVAKMSKSLKNVVNPDDVIADFGADVFRLYEMYMGPLEASKPWNTRDIIGLQRFLQRAWRLLVNEDTGELTLIDAPDDEVEKQLHRTIAKVGQDIERLAFNTAIAAMIEFTNTASGKGLTADQASRFVRLLAPFAPHAAEEIWSKLESAGLGAAPSESAGFVSDATWPTYDEAMLRDDEVEIPIQIRGKVRAKIMVPADADKDAIESIAMSDAKVKELIEGQTVRKVVVVPGRMVNIVV